MIENMKVEFGRTSDIDSWMRLVRKVSWNFPGLETEQSIEEHKIIVLKFMNDKDDWQLISKDKYESTLRGLKEMYDDLPVGLIHRDVHLGNFLFEGGEFSGYIDFDLSQRNIRLFDLCYFLLGLLSEEETIEISYDEWFVVLGQVFSAYSQIIALSETKIATVPYVMESIELLFGAWFIGQNDIACARDAIKLYEFVCENREKIVKKIYT